jgi:hypothetical protein
MTNVECPMTKEIRMTNDEVIKQPPSFRAKSRNPAAKTEKQFHGIVRLLPRLRDPLRMTSQSTFEFCHCFVIRHSSFVI